MPTHKDTLMSNTETNTETIKASTVRQAFLRESLAIIVRHHGPEDIVSTLSEVMDDYAHNYAKRSGDYAGASQIGVVAKFLEGCDSFVANYDPTVE
jgi:hypothetical protein